MNYATSGAPYFIGLERDGNGRITRKIERAAGGQTRDLHYEYDEAGQLQSVSHDLGKIERYEYENGLRTASYCVEPHYHSKRLHYTKLPGRGVRLTNVDNALILHDQNGFRASMEKDGRVERYTYTPDYRLQQVQRDGEVIQFDHDRQGRRSAKYVNGRLTERYEWLDQLRLAAAVNQAATILFHYRQGERIPFAMTYNGQELRIFADHIGSIRVVADVSGNVVQEILYDSFGRILREANPAFFLPLGFACGLHDRDLGWVRFGWRDYDPQTARFTGPDPLGQAGGDPDVYGYCLDDPINKIDPLGLSDEDVDCLSLDFNASGFGFRGEVGGGYCWDDNGEGRIMGHADVGAGSGFEVGVAGTWQKLHTPDVDNASGQSNAVGTSVSSRVIPLPLGGSIAIGADKIAADTYTGEACSVGGSWGTNSIPEKHVMRQNTWLLSPFSNN